MASKRKKISKAVNKCLNKIQKSYVKYQNNPYVPGHVHRLRVNMRKMRALLNFLKPVIGEKEYEQLNQRLREVGKKLSPLRDLDTLIEECVEVAYDEPQLVDNYADVFRFLHKERMKLIKTLSTKKTFNEIEEKLEEVENKLDKMALDAENLKAFISDRFDHKVNKLEKQYDKLDKADYENVHEVRKQAKKVRYTTAGLKKVLPKEERKSVQKNAKKIQKKLGELTDAHVIVKLLEEYKGKTSNDHLEESIETLIKYHTQ